jgi:dipeptidyl aminopeptidase/acylaminoacyl peptidase
VAVVALLVSVAGFALAFNAFFGATPRTRSGASGAVGNGLISIAHGLDQDIVLVDHTTGDVTTLVERNGEEPNTNNLAMSWSPDGSMLAFTDVRADGLDGLFVLGLFVLDLATRDILDLSADLNHAADPTWSSDGRRIAFGGADGEHGYEIYVTASDGTSRIQVTNYPDDGVSGAHMPAWSPDGERIAFGFDLYDAATKTESHGIGIVGASGGNAVTITDGPDEAPAWSPDGTTVAFVRRNVDGTSSLRIVTADGRKEHLLSRAGVAVASMAASTWSPDGTRILYSYRDLETSNLGMAVMDVDTGEVHTLIEDAFVGSPVWSPDGTRIAFLRDDAGQPLPAVSLWVTTQDGASELVLGGLAHVSDIAWQPIQGDDLASPNETAFHSGRPLKARVSAMILIGAFPRAVAVGEGSVWGTVDNANGGPDDQLVRIDPATDRIVSTTTVLEAGDVAVGHNDVWVTSRVEDDGAVLRLDPSTGQVVASVMIGDNASDLAVDDEAVWATTNTTMLGFETSGEVVRIDPATNEVVARITINGGWPRDVVVGEGSVWVYGHSDYTTARGWQASSLWQIDPTTNQLVATVLDDRGFLGDGGYLPDNVAVGEGWVWAADHSGDGVRIDPETGALTTFQPTDEGLAPNGFAWPYAVYAGHVFFGLGSIEALDTETLQVVASIPLESQVADAALDPVTGTLWIANYEGAVTRIDLH